MQFLFLLLASASLALSLPTLTALPSMITTAPRPLLAREDGPVTVSITSCSLSEAGAFTLDGQYYPPSPVCTCNGGILAGASTTVGADRSTTWNCAVGTYMPVSTQAPAPTATWVYQVEVGLSKFMVGDYDQSNFLSLMGKPCGDIGCDPSNLQDFTFNWTDTTSGVPLPATGTLSMAGNIDNSATIRQDLLQVLDTALLKSSACNQTKSLFPSNNIGKRVIEPPPTEQTIIIPQCHVVDYLQATLYSGKDPLTSSQKAQMSMAGTSNNPESSYCSEILGAINDALGLLDLPAYAVGSVTIATAFCSPQTD